MENCYNSERYPWDGIAGALARRDIPAAITMQYEVYDTHVIAFSQAFYATLASGLSLDKTMTAGRLAMYGVNNTQLDQPGFLEWGVPVLYSRLTDGQLFPERMERAGATAQAFRNTIFRVALLAVLVYAGYDYIGYDPIAFLNLTQGVGETIRMNLEI